MHPGLLCLSSRGSRPSRMLTQRVATSAAPQTASRSNRMPSGCSPLRAADTGCACTRAGPTRLSPQERATRPLGKPDATFVAGFKTWLELGTGSAGTRRRFRMIAPMPINERERPNGEETGEPLTRRKAVSLLHRLGQASICARRWARARLGQDPVVCRRAIGLRAAPASVARQQRHAHCVVSMRSSTQPAAGRPPGSHKSLHHHQGRLASLAAGARLRGLASARLLAGAAASTATTRTSTSSGDVSRELEPPLRCVAIAPRSLRLLDEQGDLPRDGLSVAVTLDAH
jgi:hypothetical protein